MVLRSVGECRRDANKRHDVLRGFLPFAWRLAESLDSMGIQNKHFGAGTQLSARHPCNNREAVVRIRAVEDAVRRDLR